MVKPANFIRSFASEPRFAFPFVGAFILLLNSDKQWRDLPNPDLRWLCCGYISQCSWVSHRPVSVLCSYRTGLKDWWWVQSGWDIHNSSSSHQWIYESRRFLGIDHKRNAYYILGELFVNSFCTHCILHQRIGLTNEGPFSFLLSVLSGWLSYIGRMLPTNSTSSPLVTLTFIKEMHLHTWTHTHAYIHTKQQDCLFS